MPSGPTQPFRLRQRIALIIALLAWVTNAKESAWAQYDDSEPSVPEVVITKPQDFPVAEIKRRWNREKLATPAAPATPTTPAETATQLATSTPDASTAQKDPVFDQSKAPADDLAKTTIVFSTVELRPIRPSQNSQQLAFPPEIEARRTEIEEKALARIFADGMITDHDRKSPDADIQRVPESFGTTPDSTAMMIVAQAPSQMQKRVLRLPEGDHSDLIPTRSTDLPELPQRELIISDEVVETSSLAEPPLVGDRLPQLTVPNAPALSSEFPALPGNHEFEGMIEIDNSAPVVVDNTFGLPAESQPNLPVEFRLPTYTLPEGGLDIYQLAPTRFSRLLPNAR
jgi:hypothetical protein